MDPSFSLVDMSSVFPMKNLSVFHSFFFFSSIFFLRERERSKGGGDYV